MRGNAIVSVHDVMPATFGRVRRILALLKEAGIPPPTLLVVPGKDWTPTLLDALRDLASSGYPLAGHGWVHQAVPTHRTPYHRLHALFISRDEAEHLSRTPEELTGMIRRSHDWFKTVDLPTPDLYVPPAWAMGSLGLRDLGALPFRWYEILRGFVEARTGRVRWVPLAGFEADTTFRKVGLRLWNRLNVAAAMRGRGPLRISIHPGDLELLLEKDLRRMLEAPWTFVCEEEALGNESRLVDP